MNTPEWLYDGAVCVNRAGEKRPPLRPTNFADYPWTDGYQNYRPHGRVWLDGKDSKRDLVGPWVEPEAVKPAEPFRLRVGGRYLTRDGRVSNPVVAYDRLYPFCAYIPAVDGRPGVFGVYRETGRIDIGQETVDDLIAEAPGEPVPPDIARQPTPRLLKRPTAFAIRRKSGAMDLYSGAEEEIAAAHAEAEGVPYVGLYERDGIPLVAEAPAPDAAKREAAIVAIIEAEAAATRAIRAYFAAENLDREHRDRLIDRVTSTIDGARRALIARMEGRSNG